MFRQKILKEKKTKRKGGIVQYNINGERERVGEIISIPREYEAKLNRNIKEKIIIPIRIRRERERKRDRKKGGKSKRKEKLEALSKGGNWYKGKIIFLKSLDTIERKLSRQLNMLDKKMHKTRKGHKNGRLGQS